MRRALALAAAAVVLAGCGSKQAATVTVRVTAPPPSAPPAAPPPAAPTATNPKTTDLATIVARVLPTVVNVRTRDIDGGRGEASGVVIDRRGVIVTNNHVVADARSIVVFLNDGRHSRPLQAQVIGTAPERDLAVLSVAAHDLVPISVGRSSKLRLGDGVLAIGFPLDLGGPTVTAGIVSGLDRTFRPETGPPLEGLLQTDAAINPGNSGGALVDLAGRLIGINTAAARAGTAENVGFAIAVDEAKLVIDEIRRKPPGLRAWLGVSLDTIGSALEAEQLGLDASVRGAVTVSVFAGGPAAKAGVHEGDVIVAIDGSPVASTEQVIKTLGQRNPGDRVTLELVDQFGPRRIELMLGKRPG